MTEENNPNNLKQIIDNLLLINLFTVIFFAAFFIFAIIMQLNGIFIFIHFIQIEGKGPQFTKTFAEAQRRLLGKYVFCASNYKDKNDQINQTIKLIIKIIYLIHLNKKFMISCNENAKKRLGVNKACIKMIDDINIVTKND